MVLKSTVEIPIFNDTLVAHNRVLRRAKPEILQLNVGKICNLTCIHCHVNAGPGRKEMMTRDTIDKILGWLEPIEIPIVDLTGGAPEMIPDFKYLILELKKQNHSRHLIDRCNLTILNEPGYEDLAEFLAEHKVEIVASMPCYTPENVEKQRGEGVFDSSITALKLLNALGYGIDPQLTLHLVYNPVGISLPPDQSELESDYKRELKKSFGIDFNNLYTITNLPIARFLSYLRSNSKYEEYMNLLVESFNPQAVEGLMCRNTISVGWEGDVFDCDFNQMMNLPMAGNNRKFIWDVDFQLLEDLPIQTGNHCYGCTAGAGSSCRGAIN